MSQKRAAIYVRVSSEEQGGDDKVSPQAQEADCRAYAQAKGYSVVGVYADTQKYRVRGRLTQPSGTRADRPKLKAMLADGRADKFDVIIAWREDRLYRSYRPMLDVLDLLDDTDIDLELAKESFDKKIAPVKAWAARMELDAKHDRFLMGMAGRLERGKLNLANPPYGYSFEDGRLVINEDQAQWVRKIFAWYLEGLSRGEMRERLIAAGAKQSETTTSNRKHVWRTGAIGRILRKELYATGIFITKWADREFETSIPTIIDMATWEATVVKREKRKAYPVTRIKVDALLAGMIRCKACQNTMCISRATRKNKRSEDIHYRCNGNIHGLGDKTTCAKTVSLKNADEIVWRALWELLSEPGRFEDAIAERVSQLQAEELTAERDVATLERHLEDVLMERQRLITAYRKGIIDDSDLETQLLTLDVQKKTLERDITERRTMLGSQSTELVKLVEHVRQQVHDKLSSLAPDAEATEEQFKLRRILVENLVDTIEVHHDKTIEIRFIVNFGPLVHPTRPELDGIFNEGVTGVPVFWQRDSGSTQIAFVLYFTQTVAN